MNPVTVALIVFLFAVCAALLGTALRAVLPPDHLDSDSKDVVKLVMGLIATLSALVLGLLIAGAQSSYNTQADALQKMSANVVELDRFLAFYGPQTSAARTQLRDVVSDLHDQVWSRHGVSGEAIGTVKRPTRFVEFYTELAKLSPRTDAQRFALSRAMQLADDVSHARLLLSEQSGGSLSLPFLAMLVFWTCVLFLGFGLLARFRVITVAVIFVGAISVGSAIFLILDLNNPYHGLIRLSDAPARAALAQLAR